MAIGGGAGGSRPRGSDLLREQGRLWIPHPKLPWESALRGSAPVCSPFAKYIFVTPQASYNASDFVALRDSWYTPPTTVTTAISSYVFFLGDSSSCGGTIIAQNQNDPTQQFLLGNSRYLHEVGAMAYGGFFLLGGNQDAGHAASEINKLIYDGGLDFVVLAIHQLPGQEPELPVVAFRHIVAALRWNWGRKKPILLMLGDNSPSVHLVHESQRDSFDSNELDLAVPPTDQTQPTPLLLGGLLHQHETATAVGVQKAEVEVLDGAGDLGLNWWPIVPFVPNSAGGQDIEGSLASLKSRFYHPLLIPSSGSGCPFFTTGNLGATSLARARSLFSATTLRRNNSLGTDGTEENVTTSAWFWHFDTVRNNSAVATWAVPRGRLTTQEADLKYLSDVNVVWESTPAHAPHPLYGQPFAMEFYLAPRSPDTSISWSSASNFGNLPALFGAKERRDGWVSSMEPFLLSPTAQVYYNQEHDSLDNTMPAIPPWARIAWPWRAPENSAWPENIQEEDSGVTGGPAGDHMVSRYGGRVSSAAGPADYRRWSAGMNARTVILSGTPDGVAAEEFGGSAALAPKLAPFALKIQVRNVLLGAAGLVYPSAMFYIIPIALPPGLEVLGATFWSEVPMAFFWNSTDFANVGGGTPLNYDMAAKQLLLEDLNITITPGTKANEILDDKGDFPPMMDAWDEDKQRALANHFARIDITHSRVVRVATTSRGGLGGWNIPEACTGIKDAGLIWPIQDDKKILILQGFTTPVTYYASGNIHCALDINYSDGSDEGETVRAVLDGVVIVADGNCAPCGNQVHIRHTLGVPPSTKSFVSVYMHLEDGLLVSKDDQVRKGDPIGRVGNTGTESEGAHLHFALSCGDTFSSNCKDNGIDPCAVLPEPSAGIEHVGPNGYEDGCAQESDIASMICGIFPDGEIECIDGVRRRIKDVALAVARAESGLDPNNYNCVDFDEDGNEEFTHRGLYQIQNPTHIDNDIAAGIIRANSVRTGGPCNSAIRVSDDYFEPERNIRSALRISGGGTDWNQWATYNPRDGSRPAFLDHLDPPC